MKILLKEKKSVNIKIFPFNHYITIDGIKKKNNDFIKNACIVEFNQNIKSIFIGENKIYENNNNISYLLKFNTFPKQNIHSNYNNLDNTDTTFNTDNINNTTNNVNNTTNNVDNIIDKVDNITDNIDNKLDKSNEIKKRSILIIIDWIFMKNNLAENRYRIIEYLRDNNDNIKVIGTGDKNFREGMDIKDVIKNVGLKKVDVIIHANNFLKENLLVSGLKEYKEAKKLLIIEDMHIPEQINKLIRNNGINGVLYHYENYQKNIIEIKNRGVDFIKFEHYIDINQFKNWGLNKEYDIILYGCYDQGVYPFRNRLFNIVKNNKDWKVKIIEFPGYGIKNKSVIRGEKLSQLINKSYIGIATSSRVDYFVKKYLEIGASGTMIAGNLPRDKYAEFQNKIIHLRENMSDDKIKEIINLELSDKKRLKNRTEILNQYILNNYSYQIAHKKFNNIIDDLF